MAGLTRPPKTASTEVVMLCHKRCGFCDDWKVCARRIAVVTLDGRAKPGHDDLFC
jgi:hypothetical protein